MGVFAILFEWFSYSLIEPIHLKFEFFAHVRKINNCILTKINLATFIFVNVARYCWKNLIFICKFSIFVPPWCTSLATLLNFCMSERGKGLINRLKKVKNFSESLQQYFFKFNNINVKKTAWNMDENQYGIRSLKRQRLNGHLPGTHWNILNLYNTKFHTSPLQNFLGNWKIVLQKILRISLKDTIEIHMLVI